MINRQKFAMFLRKVHLIQFADQFRLLLNIYNNRVPNKLFLKEHPDFVPVPHRLAYDAYHDTSWPIYHQQGLNYSRMISDLICEYIPDKKISVFEWGCGPARVVRYIDSTLKDKKANLYGADYNRKSIEWCSKNIHNVQFFNNNLEPPFPREITAGMFDCVYAISVFTHLSEKLHYLWLEELFRVIKHKGILIFTTHGDLYSRLLHGEDKDKYCSGHLVSKDLNVEEGKKFYGSFHPPEFIRNRLLKNYKILKHIPDATKTYSCNQDVWVVTRKN